MYLILSSRVSLTSERTTVFFVTWGLIHTKRTWKWKQKRSKNKRETSKEIPPPLSTGVNGPVCCDIHFNCHNVQIYVDCPMQDSSRIVRRIFVHCSANVIVWFIFTEQVTDSSDRFSVEMVVTVWMLCNFLASAWMLYVDNSVDRISQESKTVPKHIIESVFAKNYMEILV